jgi:2-polyprenyl-6-methoxyphenol hydroxylase-like FAD-dependent oxidoreductase
VENQKTVLISGASIAGLTMAYWMNHYGYRVTLVETGASPRIGGSPIDVRGGALDTARRMGILKNIQDARLGTEGLDFVNAQNQTLSTMLVENIGPLRPGEDIELRRDDLVNILYRQTGQAVEYLFNNRIQNIVQHSTHVEVTYRDGIRRDFDFVIGADGLHSGVRKLVFGPEEQFKHPLDLYFAIFEVDDNIGKRNRGQMYNTPDTMATIYCYNKKADAVLVFRNAALTYDYRDPEAQKRIVRDAFAGGQWKVPQLLEELGRVKHFYFDQVCQIKMPCWSRGRVALIGDAAYCPGFPTGMGSTLAMQGAGILADALAENADHKVAFQQYEEQFRPIVDTLQATVYEGISFLLPETQEAIDRRNMGG